MARTDLAVQTIVDEGLNPAYTAAPLDGHMIPGDGEVYIHVKNAGAASINVTIQTGGTLMGEPVTDKVVAVPNGGERLIGPFPPALYNQPSGVDAGKVYVDFSAVTSVTVAALR